MASGPASISLVYKHDESAGDIPAQVFYDPHTESSTTKPRPMVMIIHAGGYVCGGTYLIPRNQIARLVDMGFVVVTPEYRLCPQVSVLEGPVTDMRECLRWTKTELPAILEEKAGIAVDPARVGVMGQSAGGNLATVLGGEKGADRPSAVLCVYGTVYPERDFYRQPFAGFAALPDPDPAFVEKVFEGPVPVAVPPMFKDGRPDMSTPRNAWMLNNLKRGTHTAECVKDGDYAAVSGASFVDGSYPPTALLHGTEDKFAPYGFAQYFAADLEKNGVAHELITASDQDHMFDMAITTEDPLFGYIQQGLDFLQKHV